MIFQIDPLAALALVIAYNWLPSGLLSLLLSYLVFPVLSWTNTRPVAENFFKLLTSSSGKGDVNLSTKFPSIWPSSGPVQAAMDDWMPSLAEAVAHCACPRTLV